MRFFRKFTDIAVHTASAIDMHRWFFKNIENLYYFPFIVALKTVVTNIIEIPTEVRQVSSASKPMKMMEFCLLLSYTHKKCWIIHKKITQLATNIMPTDFIHQKHFLKLFNFIRVINTLCPSSDHTRKLNKKRIYTASLSLNEFKSTWSIVSIILLKTS